MLGFESSELIILRLNVFYLPVALATNARGIGLRRARWSLRSNTADRVDRTDDACLERENVYLLSTAVI